MDIPALQARLRSFAAARDWQPYHSPKNLAMALMVEAAELLELFQWKTITESRGLTRNPADKERVADEIADVLLYLLQLADHTGVDVEQAVEAKLRKNAAKHPALHPALHPELPPPAPASARVHLLVDWENVQPTGEAIKALVPQGTDVWLFHGPQQKVNTASHVQAYGADRVTLVPRSGAGRNALDFQLSYYVGYIAARQPGGAFTVVSNDQGYDPMLEHARELGFDARRCGFQKPASAAKPKPDAAALSPAIPALPSPAPAPQAPPEPIVDDAALVVQVAESAFSNLRVIPIANRPREEGAVLDYFRLFIPLGVQDKVWLARRAWKLLLDRGDLLAQKAVHPVISLPATKAVVAPVKKAAPAAVSASAKATRQDVQQLTQWLEGLAPAQRPARKNALLVLIQSHLGEPSPHSPRAAHALAQLQALKQVVLKKDAVSYPPVPAAPVKKAAAKKTAAPATPKPAPKPTASQIAQAVLASLKKMPNNKPTRRTALLEHIKSHAAKAADPKAMAQQVCALLEARHEVVMSADGKGVSYPKMN